MLRSINKGNSVQWEIQIPHNHGSNDTEKLLPVLLFSALAGIVATCAALARIRFSGFEIFILAACIVFIMGIICARLLENRRLPETVYYLILWKALGAICVPLTYMCAMSRLPLYDEELVSIDRILGFDWPSYYALLTKNSIITTLLKFAYYSLMSQITFSVIFFSFSRRYDRNSELFCTALISLVITGIVSGIFPAAGTFYHYGIDLARAIHLQDYFALRNGTVSNFDILYMKGIVTFPSFHTTAAILFIYAYRGTRIFSIALFLNILMLLSTPVFGGHYLVDMLGGVAVAYFSVFITSCARNYTNGKLFRTRHCDSVGHQTLRFER